MLKSPSLKREGASPSGREGLFTHEIIASNYRAAVKGESDRLELTGDNKEIFQNLRAFQRALDLMRTAHNDGGER